ncbi:hypothetical protein PLICRDRAFT_87611 [Plicaturopsis crispa FD-325 SS-3]|nr:hypothetical protein PLICRDRAFT_87611 [Plicaturopsis crispa FD-325 SS-3]
MLQVQAHHGRHRIPLFRGRPYYFLQFLVTLLSVLSAICGVTAQVLVNGQTFTNGLAIVDAPNPSSSFSAGSNMPIAIDISGDGKLPQNAAVPGSGLATRYDSLEIYLVSSQTQLNMTVSSGTGLLMQEPGSTVKHLNFAIPTCVPAGKYNLTFYEASHINNNAFFTISPVPVQINNANPSGACGDNVNAIQDQPQDSSPAAQSPFLPGSAGQSSGFLTVVTGTGMAATTVPGLMTVTINSGVLPWPLYSIPPLAVPSVLTVTATATNTMTLPPVSITVVVESMETITSTAPGGVTTKTVTSLSTTTAVMSGSPVDNSGFVPVNSAPTRVIGTLYLAALISGSVLPVLWWTFSV